jgi:hypothetical protein
MDMFKRWAIDLMGPMAEPDQATKAKYILVCVDSYSHWVEVEALPDKTSASVLRALKSSIFFRYGTPEVIACDRGGEFYGAVAEYCAEVGTKMVRGSAYHPQAQGAVERVNRTLQEALCGLMHGKPANTWGDYLHQAAASAGRMIRHSSTKYAPYYVLFGKQPPNPVPTPAQPGAGNPEVGNKRAPTEAELEQDVKRRNAAREGSEQLVHNNIAAAQKKQQQDYAKRMEHIPGTPVVGTKVHVATVKQGKEQITGPYTYMGKGTGRGTALLQGGDGTQLEVMYNRLRAKKADIS